jgi:hypothetical protein
MVEYKVRVSLTGGEADAEQICNRMAKDGWRLASTAMASQGISVTLFMFFEREVPGEQRPSQDAWRTQHRGEDE